MVAVTSRPHADTAGTFAGRVLDGQSLQSYLATPDGLRESAARISSVVANSGCTDVVPASSSATAAVAAAVLLDPDISMCDTGAVRSGRVDKVLVVETVAVSGLRARQTVRKLNEAGANWVGVAVLYPVLGDEDTDVAEMLGLDALEATFCP